MVPQTAHWCTYRHRLFRCKRFVNFLTCISAVLSQDGFVWKQGSARPSITVDGQMPKRLLFDSCCVRSLYNGKVTPFIVLKFLRPNLLTLYKIRPALAKILLSTLSHWSSGPWVSGCDFRPAFVYFVSRTLRLALPSALATQQVLCIVYVDVCSLGFFFHDNDM